MYPDSSIISYGGLNRIMRAGSDGWMDGRSSGLRYGRRFGSGKRKNISLFSEVVGEILWRCEVLGGGGGGCICR